MLHDALRGHVPPFFLIVSASIGRAAIRATKWRARAIAGYVRNDANEFRVDVSGPVGERWRDGCQRPAARRCGAGAPENHPGAAGAPLTRRFSGALVEEGAEVLQRGASDLDGDPFHLVVRLEQKRLRESQTSLIQLVMKCGVRLAELALQIAGDRRTPSRCPST